MNAREKEKESMSRNVGHGGIDFSSKWQNTDFLLFEQLMYAWR
jgi:hypothetical protein